MEPEGYCDSAKSIIENIGKVDYRLLNRNQLKTVLPKYDILIVRLKHQIDKEILELTDRLKIIVTATTGLDHIDLEYTTKKNIAVLSLKGELAFLDSVQATAEHTWALLLSLIRNIPQAFSSVKNNTWERDKYKGIELHGKTLGLIGYGRIGSKIAKYGVNIAKDGIIRNAIQILSQKSVDMLKIREIWPQIKYVSREIDEQIEINSHYKGYLKKQNADIIAFKRDENLIIPENLNYDEFSGLSNEVKSKFKQIKPKTMGQALRIDGITPAAVYILLSHLKRKSIKHIA